MDTQHLSYFLTLCDTPNYTAAAERCFITRQAMRQCVQALEAAYGLPLIENRKNRLFLTPAGALLREQAQPVVDAYARLEALMRSCRGASIPLRLGVSRSLLPFYAPELTQQLANFPAACPGLMLDTVMLSADEVIAGLQDGSLDAGFIVDDGPLALPFRRTVFREDTMTVILSARHPLAGQSQITLGDLDGLPFNLMADPATCFPHFYKALKAAGASPQFAVVPEYVDVNRNIRDNLTVGMDCTVAGTSPSYAPDRVLPLDGGRFTLHVSLLTPHSSVPAASMLAAFLAENAQTA